MKKKLIVLVLFLGLLICGCGKQSKDDVVKKITQNVESAKSYYLEGNMDIINNEDVYSYNVNVSYKNDDYYRVSLTNKSNNHEQIILKNNDGVYVLTPSLGKSFKFQSEWPYNNSQVYLLQSLINDISEDDEYKFEFKDNTYIIETKVDYPNNNNLKTQKIYLDDDLNFSEVHVLDKNGAPQIKMKFNKIEMNKNFNKNHFDTEENLNSGSTSDEAVTTSSIDNAIYPMYLPEETYLESEDTVKKDDGERLILTFAGENPFMIVEETVSVSNEFESIPTIGEPEILTDTVGAISDNSVTWISNGIEYYISSDTLESSELVNIAKSLTVSALEK